MNGFYTGKISDNTEFPAVHPDSGKTISVVPAAVARTLERELAEARAQAAYFRERLEAWQDANGHMADRFEAARVDNARLRGALTQIANSGDAYNDLRTTARAALEVQS